MEKKESSQEEMKKEKLAHDKYIMAEFFASWCPHCQRMMSIVEELKKSMKAEGIVEVIQIDVDLEKHLADLYEIDTVPTFILMKEGEQLWRKTGEQTLRSLEKAARDFKP